MLSCNFAIILSSVSTSLIASLNSFFAAFVSFAASFALMFAFCQVSIISSRIISNDNASVPPSSSDSRYSRNVANPDGANTLPFIAPSSSRIIFLISRRCLLFASSRSFCNTLINSSVSLITASNSGCVSARPSISPILSSTPLSVTDLMILSRLWISLICALMSLIACERVFGSSPTVP